MLLFVLSGLLLLRFAVRLLFALFEGDAERPERILTVRNKFLSDRRDPPPSQEFVQLLLGAALPVGGDLDEFKWHGLFSEKYRGQGLRPYNPFD